MKRNYIPFAVLSFNDIINKSPKGLRIYFSPSILSFVLMPYVSSSIFINFAFPFVSILNR